MAGTTHDGLRALELGARIIAFAEDAVTVAGEQVADMARRLHHSGMYPLQGVMKAVGFRLQGGYAPG